MTQRLLANNPQTALALPDSVLVPVSSTCCWPFREEGLSLTFYSLPAFCLAHNRHSVNVGMSACRNERVK